LEMKAWYLSVLLSVALLGAQAQQVIVDPQVRTSAIADHKITIVDVVPHFVTTIRVPEPVNSVVVGDPALFQVEHSEREPELVFVKALREESAETNLLISTARGRQISFLLVNHSQEASASKADFLLRYQAPTHFLIEPEVAPFALVSETTPLQVQDRGTTPRADSTDVPSFGHSPRQESPDALLERQRRAPLPKLYGERIESDDSRDDRLRAGISEVIDGGQQVVVLFSVINTSKKPILLMPPQVQLGGKEKSGRLIKHERWSTAEQLAVIDFRLSRRRVAPGGRADGVVQFERPPYKRSTETLFLQMAESGAVDRPALVPIGFGVSTAVEASNHEQ
jgi:hypothetical protein